jgi:hypothetical protein
MAVVIAVVIVTSTTKRTNDGIHDHEHDPIVADSCVGEHKYGRHGGLAMACAGVVVAAPEEVAAIIITHSGRVPVAIQWIVNNITVVVANDSTSGIG